MSRAPLTAKSYSYFIPSLLTAFNLTCGILAILLSLVSVARGGESGGISQFAMAAWLILAAMVFDYLDGKVARLIHAESDFGVKIDSLTDFISFGVAPVTMAYLALLTTVPVWLQSLACLAFLFAGAWRLARFNCEACQDNTPHAFFTGLPIPAASAFVCALVLVNYGSHAGEIIHWLNRPFAAFPPALIGWANALLMISLSLLMVSRIPFPAFKNVNRRNLIILGGVAVFFGVLSLVLPLENIILLIMVLYLMVGMAQFVLNRVLPPLKVSARRGRRSRRRKIGE